MYKPIQLDKARNLRYNMVAISLIEETLGVESVFDLDFEKLSMKKSATIVWAGLVHEDKSLTVEETMNLIDEHSSFVEVMQLVIPAFMAYFTKGQDNSKNAQKVAKAKNTQSTT